MDMLWETMEFNACEKVFLYGKLPKKIETRKNLTELIVT
jgi:hypothetical protein